MNANSPATGNRDPAQWRLGLALCASAVAHAWLLAALPHGAQHLPPAVTVPARLELREMAAELALVSGILESLGKADAPAPVSEERTRTKPARPAARKANPAPAEERSTVALPQAADLSWYGAHELDSYPRALAPLHLDHRVAGAGGAGARLLLWLRIDELGRIVEVTAGEAGVPGELLDAARASLAAVRFTPARKDERAVRSRVLLAIELAHANEQPLAER